MNELMEMMEYKIINNREERLLINHMEVLTQDGWEVINIYCSGGNMSAAIHYAALKRKKND